MCKHGPWGPILPGWPWPARLPPPVSPLVHLPSLVSMPPPSIPLPRPIFLSVCLVCVFVYYCVFVYLCVVCVWQRRRRSENHFQYVGPRYHTQVVRLGGRSLLPAKLSHWPVSESECLFERPGEYDKIPRGLQALFLVVW